MKHQINDVSAIHGVHTVQQFCTPIQSTTCTSLSPTQGSSIIYPQQTPRFALHTCIAHRSRQWWLTMWITNKSEPSGSVVQLSNQRLPCRHDYISLQVLWPQGTAELSEAGWLTWLQNPVIFGMLFCSAQYSHLDYWPIGCGEGKTVDNVWEIYNLNLIITWQ